MKYRLWPRLMLVIFNTSVGCLLTASCAKTDAQAVTSPNTCSAEIVSLGAAKQCPTAPVRFHVSVSGCDNSSGTFEYEYMRVGEGIKALVHSTGAWTAASKDFEQVEHVPLSCDNEVDHIDNVHMTSCHCPS